jgi:hypothetical protein
MQCRFQAEVGARSAVALKTWERVFLGSLPTSYIGSGPEIDVARGRSQRRRAQTVSPQAVAPLAQQVVYGSQGLSPLSRLP